MSETPLGEFLRARRGLLSPETIGVTPNGRRRVPGLRREEVATMAGLSVDYYTRLEQGRERHPSAQVLEALSSALRIDDDTRLHLFRVAGAIPSPEHGTSPERVSAELMQLMDMWPDNPAIILGKAYDVLAGNRIAYALFEGFQHGPNLMATLFLDPDSRTFYRDWVQVAAYTVAGFRVLYGAAPDDPRINEVLRTLIERSTEFVELWQRHEARSKRLERKRFRHREVGDLTLHVNAFDVKAAPGQELIVYHADPDTPSADALSLLGTVTAAHSR